MLKNVFIMGAGTMGSGIAQSAAESGYYVTLNDINDERARNGINTIEKGLDRRIKRGDLKEADNKAIISRIKGSTSIDDARDADIIIEAIPEVLSLKLDVFGKLDAICPPATILASNTSALPISSMAAATRRTDKVIGIHFMNPVYAIKGVEVIVGRYTSDETVKISKEFVKSLGKEPCEARDYAGFIVSRLVDVLMNEAIELVRDGNKPEEVDKAMKLCCSSMSGAHCAKWGFTRNG